MSELGNVLGGKHEFVHKGKTYHVSLVTQDIKLAYERRLFARAKEVAREMRDLMDREDYQVHLKQLNDDYIAGEYAFMSERGMKAMATVESGTYLISLLFGISENETLGIVAEAPDEITALLDVVLKESFPVDQEKLKKRQAEKEKKEADAGKESDQGDKKKHPEADAPLQLVSASR